MKKIQPQSSCVNPALVTCPISHRNPKDSVLGFDVFSRSVKVVRPPAKHLIDCTPPDRTGSELQGFSKKSRSRLRFTAANSADHISSQFCMTYADYWPINGKECKRHLDTFLKAVKRFSPNIHYIWIGEFQTRGCPHFHFFSDLEVTPANHERLAAIWHRVVGVSQKKHASVHLHQKNFIEWTMGNGSYLCKYLDKEHQKHIPEGWQTFGRWWGNSRNLKPVADHLSKEELDIFVSDAFKQTTGEILVDSAPQFLIRTLVKYQQKQFKSAWGVKRSQTMTVLTGASVFRQALKHLEQQARRRKE